MSIEAVSWALRVPIGGNPKVLLLGLANHAHPDGSEAYPSVETLAEYAHCDRRTVQRNLRQLERDGWAVRDGIGPRGQWKWRLPVDGRQDAIPDLGGAALDARGGGIDGAGGAALVPPEPSKEPIEGTGEDARAAAADSLPDDFPDELKPHARVVFRLLRVVAEEQGARAVKPVALGRMMMARPRKPFVTAAHDFAAWAADPPRPVRDVVASYRRWLDRERDLAAVERIAPREEEAAVGRSGRFDRRVIRDE